MEHEHREHHKRGGKAEAKGRDEAAMDEKTKPEAYDKSRVEGEAEEKKRGGKAEHHRHKRKHGGKVEHEHKAEHRHERKRGGKAMGGKEMGCIKGEDAKHHAGRKPRASGGAACEKSPFTSAAKGHNPPGHKTPGSVSDH